MLKCKITDCIVIKKTFKFVIITLETILCCLKENYMILTGILLSRNNLTSITVHLYASRIAKLNLSKACIFRTQVM